jgi:hypothetical protein
MGSGTVLGFLDPAGPERKRQWCMNLGHTVFAQFMAMAFARLSYRGSLRDIEACLRSMSSKLYHTGFRGKVARSTLADANESRDWRIYADFAQVLIRIARPSYAHHPIGVDLDQSLYALEATTIDLCLSLFPWAKFRKHKAAVEIHANIPTFIRITGGKVHGVNILDEIHPEPGTSCVMDRAYVNFERLYVFTLCPSFFVVRAKKNVLPQRRYSHPVDKSTGALSDQTVILIAIGSARAYPGPLRRLTTFRRFSVSRFSKERPFCRPFKHRTTKMIWPTMVNSWFYSTFSRTVVT